MISLSRAEAGKQCLDLTGGPEAVERLASETFASACAADTEGRWDVELANEYDKASLLLEALAQFREQCPAREVEQKVHHARQRAALIRSSTQCVLSSAFDLGAGGEGRPPLGARSAQPASFFSVRHTPSMNQSAQATRAVGLTLDPWECAVPNATEKRLPSRVQKAALSKAEQAMAALSCNDVAGSRRLVTGALEILESGTE